MGTIASVNVSPIRTVEHDGKSVSTGIFKTPVAGRVAVAGIQVAGDEQADRAVHGGPDRAVYAYAAEDYAWWSGEIGRDLNVGTFGENVTLRDVDVTNARIGERWRIGTATVQVTSPRVPCYKLGIAVGDAAFIKRFARALRPGAYLTIVEPGDIAAGDAAVPLTRPDHQLTIAEMARIYLFERKRSRELLVPELPDEWRQWVIEHSGPK